MSGTACASCPRCRSQALLRLKCLRVAVLLLERAGGTDGLLDDAIVASWILSDAEHSLLH